MSKTNLWTKNFIALVATNGLLFASFHVLLPTLPIYAANIGANGVQIGIISGIFGFSAIFIRLFTDTGIRAFGKKNCLYIGLFLSLFSTLSYAFFNSIGQIITARVIHGLGFGLSTTFSAALAADVIPAARRGEGIGYLGLGSTIAMALAPAAGLTLLSDFGPLLLCIFSALVTFGAVLTAYSCSTSEPISDLPTSPIHSSIYNKLCERGTGMPALLTILFGIAYGSVNTFIALMAAEVGIANSGCFFIVGTLFVFLSRPFGGRLLDLKGPFWVILPGGLLYACALIIILSAKSLPVLLAGAVLYGLGAGLLLPALMTWMLNVVRADRRSAASATFYNMLDIGTSSGLLILGGVAGNIGYVNMYKYVLGAMVLFIFLILAHHFLRQPKKALELEENES